MPTNSRRTVATRVVAATATVAAGLGAAAFVMPSADAANSTLVTVSKVSVHHVAATTLNQVITVTGTGFDEDVISGVTIAGCVTAPTYVVTSPTTLSLKTAVDCAVGTNKAITVTDTSSNTAVTNPTATGGAMALDFVDAPALLTGDATHNPVVSENSQNIAYASQVLTGPTTGGTTIRIKSAAATPFVNTTAYPLAASVDGVALTKVTMHTGGDYLTGVIGAHAADAAPTVKVTSNGVTKSFPYHAAGSGMSAGDQSFQYAGTGITVSPASGPVNGGNVISITGAGFTTSTTATVNSVSCPVSGTPTATVFKCTVAGVTTAGPVTVATSTGGVTSVVGAGSTYTFLGQ